MSNERYIEALGCYVSALQYSYRLKTGELYMPSGCCDMGACINLFVGIDDGVVGIKTYSNGEPDTYYRRDVSDVSKWQAFDTRS